MARLDIGCLQFLSASARILAKTSIPIPEIFKAQVFIDAVLVGVMVHDWQADASGPDQISEPIGIGRNFVDCKWILIEPVAGRSWKAVELFGRLKLCASHFTF